MCAHWIVHHVLLYEYLHHILITVHDFKIGMIENFSTIKYIYFEICILN